MGIKIDPKSSIIFSTKQLEILLNTYGNFNTFLNNDIWGKKFDHKSSTIFSTKPLKIWLNTLYGHINYKGYEICATIQGKYNKCTRLSFVKDFNWFWTTLLFFLSPKGRTPMSCTLFNFHMKIPIFSLIMIFGEIFFTLSHPPFFQPNH